MGIGIYVAYLLLSMGLTIAVGSGTNQERILLDWNKQLEAKGKKPATLEYYQNAADSLLASLSPIENKVRALTLADLTTLAVRTKDFDRANALIEDAIDVT